MVSKSYALNAQKAVSETVDGESIVINLETGAYYSLNQTGSVIWGLALARYSQDTIGTYCSTRYGIGQDMSSQHVRSFLEHLVAEGLLLESQEHDAAVAAPPWGEPPEAFTPPALERYDDMKEMLLADPIHDVGDGGWPILKKDAA